MGDDVSNQCRWAANANAENDSELIDLPPSEQVSRGKELLSMLSGFGGGKENSSSALRLFETQQPQSEQRRPTAGLRISAPAESAVSSAMLPSHPQDCSQIPGYHPAAAAVEAQPQVTGFADPAADWMMSQGHFASRPSLSPTSSPPVPTWGSSGSGLAHTANAPAGSSPWAALSTTPPGGRAHNSWPMGTAPPDAQQLAGGSPVMHMHGPAMTRCPAPGGLAAAAEAASWATPGHSVARIVGAPEIGGTYASWSSASLGSSVSPTMASLHHTQTPAVFPALATAAPMTAMSYADQPTMFSRNQMRAEAAPYVPGTAC
eukprot:TRINITY_DN5719_c0_g1_i1.p1 TRINITY_DN5719_c0_g1~~TRINITY_DN5719_c0_g1_i1.p1  ORF type:complete len:349 (-),score=53.69 TRINITY_DN5719_c0_g1_i1:198-1151(-)